MEPSNTSFDVNFIFLRSGMNEWMEPSFMVVVSSVVSQGSKWIVVWIFLLCRLPSLTVSDDASCGPEVGFLSSKEAEPLYVPWSGTSSPATSNIFKLYQISRFTVGRAREPAKVRRCAIRRCFSRDSRHVCVLLPMNWSTSRGRQGWVLVLVKKMPVSTWEPVVWSPSSNFDALVVAKGL